MKFSFANIKNQLKINIVAIISLITALSGLAYNSWRNETTELNRNLRTSAFQILLNLNELQKVVFFLRYDGDDKNHGNPRIGWTYVLSVKDFSSLLPPNYQNQAVQLQSTWQENWQTIASDNASGEKVQFSIDQSRLQILELLKKLK